MRIRRSLAEGLVASHPDEAANVLEALDAAEAAAFLATLEPPLAAGVLLRTTAHPATAILAELERARAARVVTKLPVDVAAAYLRRLPAEGVEGILSDLAPGRARSIRSLLRFREGTAGALMDPEVLALPADLTVRDAVERVRKSAEKARYNLYVVDREDVLVGVFNLRELLLAPTRRPLEEIMQSDVMRVSAELSWRALVDHPGWREVHALPVVDAGGTYLGAVRYRTLRQLEARLRAPTDPGDVTARTLGELFSMGLTGAIEALAAASPAGRDGRDGPRGGD
jgi:magnesium transporter